MNKNISKNFLTTTLLMLLFSCGEISSLPPIASSNISSEKRLEININNLKSKKEMGDSYGLGGTDFGINPNQKTKEWYEQANAFETFSIGKTKEYLTQTTFENKYNYNEGSFTMIEGCTISQEPLINAIKNTTHNLTFSTDRPFKRYIGVACDKFQDNTLSFTISNSIIDNEDKIIKSSFNAYDIPVIISQKSKLGYSINQDAIQTKKENLDSLATSNYTTEVLSKRELGSLYGMGNTSFGINPNQKTKEWYEQADYFSNFIEGKSVKEINSLTFLNKYNYEDSNADKYVFIEGCTISQSSFITSLNKSINIKPITQINNGSYTLSVGSSVNIDNLNSCISLSIASYITNDANIICGLNVDVIEAKFTIK